MGVSPPENSASPSSFIRLVGGNPVSGEVNIPGDKISAVHCLLASIIADIPSEIHNVPLCGDVRDIFSWATSTGQAKIEVSDTSTVTVQPLVPRTQSVLSIRHLRSSICAVTALALERGQITFHSPGGCDFTKRPVDRHIALSQAFGLNVRETQGGFVATLDRMPTSVSFDCASSFGPSVGVTCHALMAALRFGGAISLRRCACEPVIGQLAALIETFTGRRIIRSGRQIHISARSNTVSAIHRAPTICLPPDATVLTTYLALLAACTGALTLSGVDGDIPFLKRLLPCWGLQQRSHKTIHSYSATFARHLGSVVCKPWPGLPSDVGPLLVASVAAVPGITRLRDSVYSERNSHVPGLRAMGYSIFSAGPDTIVVGATPNTDLVRVAAPDIRAGAALIIGAMARPATAEITQIHQIARGYVGLFDNLRRLGADLCLYAN